MFSTRKYFEVLFLLSLLLILVTGCKKDDSNPADNSAPTTFVGTWKLTMLSTTISGQPISMTPDMAGTQMTIVSKSDATFTMSTTDASGTTNYSGTWSISGSNLILKYSDNTSATFAFTMSGNTLSIKDYPYTHPTYGQLLLKLDFAKQ